MKPKDTETLERPRFPQNRPSWDDFFMRIAEEVSTRSTCVRRRIGAVLVKNNLIISTGYNGPPRGVLHRTEETCIRNVENIPSGEKTERECCAHAEANAVAFAAYNGHSTSDSTLYTMLFPCSYCARFIVNAGIIRIVYKERYPNTFADSIFDASENIECVQYV